MTNESEEAPGVGQVQPERHIAQGGQKDGADAQNDAQRGFDDQEIEDNIGQGDLAQEDSLTQESDGGMGAAGSEDSA